MERPVPILFLGDAPSGRGGLARIGRDLAVLTATLPQFRVGFLGRGGQPTRQLPFAQYTFDETFQWGESLIERTWFDFAERERGIVFTIWDATRLHWFAQPRWLPAVDVADAGLRNFLMAGHFDRWGYFPVDATGPGDHLTSLAANALGGYDRVLAYTQFGQGVIERSIGAAPALVRGLTWLPHGLDMQMWQPSPRKEARKVLGSRFHDDDIVLGVVATNQPRKDWGLVAVTTALLRQKFGRRLRCWWHSDVEQRSFAWSLPALVRDFGLADFVSITTHAIEDAVMAQCYSACDVTLHPGLGEGFGYPAVESLACGTPIVAVDYAGLPCVIEDRTVARFVPTEINQDGKPVVRLETIHNCMRPVVSPEKFAAAVESLLAAKVQQEQCRAAVQHLDWKTLWPGCWKKWLLAGVK
jgi:glycosyltransferase involved in cell wall biosynthesis